MHVEKTPMFCAYCKHHTKDVEKKTRLLEVNGQVVGEFYSSGLIQRTCLSDTELVLSNFVEAIEERTGLLVTGNFIRGKVEKNSRCKKEESYKPII